MNHAYDPELAPSRMPFARLDLTDPIATRNLLFEAQTAMPAPEVPADLRVRDAVVPGRAGAPDVPVRVYTPTHGARPLPALLYIHGGSFVLGDLEMTHPLLMRLALDLEAVVVAVDYRLAPENPFPAGLEDCYATLTWMARNAADIDVDPDRIAVGGDSSGGTMSAGLALLTRDRGGPRIRFQYLGVPVLDDRLESDSIRELVDVPVLDREILELTWRHYLSGSSTVDGKDGMSYAAPARAEDLSALPAAFVAVSELDPLRDEALDYARRLMKAGVSVELRLYAGTVHGTYLLAQTKAAQRMRADLVQVLRRALSPERA
ncbi:alpha/beta hydrolase [Nonomuraea terrae]|uniref:alpha/beta hydrolase n=1 Tax=Nonomuraea terrae TaxID=2530383 RepID=UPI00378C3219